MGLIDWIRERHQSRKTSAAFACLMAMPRGEWLYGPEIGRRAKLRPGRLYPALTLLLDAEEVTDRWTSEDPPRRQYMSR